jgi:hypothetical protein
LRGGEREERVRLKRSFAVCFFTTHLPFLDKPQ